MSLGLPSVAAALLLIAYASPAAAQPSIRASLERYQQGEFDAVVKELAAVKDPRALARAFMRDAKAWIADGPGTAGRRRLAAAALSVELTHARLASDWHVFRDTLDWSAKELRSGSTSPAERAFWLASIALGQRARDNVWLIRPGRHGSPRHLEAALNRFADDPRLRLASLVVASYRIDADIEALVRRFEFTHGAAGAVLARKEFETAIGDMKQLTGDPTVGADASNHLAQLFVNLRDHAAAAAHAGTAARTAREPATAYVAHVLAGRSLTLLNRRQEAIRAYEAALQAVPGGQSASLALAGLITDGDPQRAAALVDGTLSARPGDDPWRLFPYGEFVRWPILIAQLRDGVR